MIYLLTSGHAEGTPVYSAFEDKARAENAFHALIEVVYMTTCTDYAMARAFCDSVNDGWDAQIVPVHVIRGADA